MLGRSESKIFKKFYCFGNLEVNLVGEILKWVYSMNTSLVLQSQTVETSGQRSTGCLHCYTAFSFWAWCCSVSQLLNKYIKLHFCVSPISTFWKLTASTSDSVKLAGKHKCCKMCVLTLVKGCHQDFVLVIIKHGVWGENNWDENTL